MSLKRVVFFTSMPSRIPLGIAPFACYPSRSGISTLFGWVMKHVMAVDVPRFCIATLKPRSFDAWPPIAYTTEYGTRMCRRVCP